MTRSVPPTAATPPDAAAVSVTFRRIGLLPLWLRASAVILAGILLSVWLTGETTRRLDEAHRLADMRTGVLRATHLLAGLVSESVVTADPATADAIIRQYVSTWPQVTFVHVSDSDGNHFTEWQQQPIKFGDGILKFEVPVEFGRQTFGTLSLYVDLRDTLASIHARAADARRSEALTLLALALLIIALVNYVALEPVRALGDRAAALLRQRRATPAEDGDEVAQLRAALDLLERMPGGK